MNLIRFFLYGLWFSTTINLSFAQPISGGEAAINVNNSKLNTLQKFDPKTEMYTKKVITISNKDFELEIPQTPKQFYNGLNGRTSLPPNTGMVFFFNGGTKVQMTMEKTAIPLDILFIDKNNEIACIFSENKPYSKDKVSCDKSPIIAVIEINAGESKKYQLAEGLKVEGL